MAERLGSLEQLLLLALLRLGDDAYGVPIRDEIEERTGRVISPGWHEVGRFLGPSIRRFHAAYPAPALVVLWRDAGIAGVRLRRLSLGGGIVVWGERQAGVERDRPATAVSPGRV